jgi:hypothetical protein
MGRYVSHRFKLSKLFCAVFKCGYFLFCSLKGWSHKYNTWEPTENIIDVRLIDSYERTQKKKVRRFPKEFEKEKESSAERSEDTEDETDCDTPLTKDQQLTPDHEDQVEYKSECRLEVESTEPLNVDQTPIDRIDEAETIDCDRLESFVDQNVGDDSIDSRIPSKDNASHDDSGIYSFFESNDERPIDICKSVTTPLNEVNILKRCYSDDKLGSTNSSLCSKRVALSTNANLSSSQFVNDLFVQKETYDDTICKSNDHHEHRNEPPCLNHLIKRIETAGPESDTLIIKKIVDNQNRVVNTNVKTDDHDSSRLKELNIPKESSNKDVGKRSSIDVDEPIKPCLNSSTTTPLDGSKSAKTLAKRFKHELFKKKHLFDQILITDVTAHNTTITVRECKTVKAFFKDRNGKKSAHNSNHFSAS